MRIVENLRKMSVVIDTLMVKLVVHVQSHKQFTTVT